MLANLSIRAKITAVVAFLLVAMTGTGLLAVRNMRAIDASTVDITTNWLPSVRVLGELRAGVITYRNVIREHMLGETAEEKQATEKVLAGVIEANAKTRQSYERLITTAEERALYNQWLELWERYKKGTEEVIALSRKSVGKPPHEAHQLNAQTVNKIGIEADDVLKKSIELNNAGADQAGRNAADYYAFAVTMVGVMTGVAIIIGIAVGMYMVRDVSRGIASIVAPMQALGRGELTAQVPHQGEKTEIGSMADSLQVFKEALIAKKAADDAAAREAEAKIERGRRVDDITRKFESMIGEIVNTVSSASTQLESSASTLTATAGRSRELTTVVAAASEEASTNVQSVASATEEMASSITEISRQVQESARMAGGAVNEARKTNDRVSELSKAASPHRRCGRTDQHHRRTDQPVGAQRHHRGGARRRGRPRFCGRGIGSEGAGRTDREGDRRDRPADQRHPGGDAGIGERHQGNQHDHRKTVRDFLGHRRGGGTAGRGDPGDFPQRPAGRPWHPAGFVQHYRRAARRQRDRFGVLAGPLGGAVVVRRFQSPQAGGRQVPQFGQGGLRREGWPGARVEWEFLPIFGAFHVAKLCRLPI